MRPNPRPSPSSERQNRRRMTRRALLKGAGLAPFLAATAASQEPPLREVIRRMTAMTDSTLPEPWVDPTTGLVGVILDYSKTLRALDLGEREPATSFQAR